MKSTPSPKGVVAAVEHSAHYGKQLEAFAGTVRQSPSLKVVNGHVGGILAETQKICERNHDLEDQLRESAAEIAALKKQLEEAHETANTDALTSRQSPNVLRTAAQLCPSREKGRRVVVPIDDRCRPLQAVQRPARPSFWRSSAQTGCPRSNRERQGRDTVARYGGEEFAVILPDTDLADATCLAETLRGSVESRRIVKRGSKEAIGSLTVSIGVAAYRSSEDIGSLIERADDAVYAAKAKGRNCVVANEESAGTLCRETGENETEQEQSAAQTAQSM